MFNTIKYDLIFKSGEFHTVWIKEITTTLNKLEKIVEKGHDPITPIAAKLIQKSDESSPYPEETRENQTKPKAGISAAKQRWNKAKIVGKIGSMANKVIKSKVSIM